MSLASFLLQGKVTNLSPESHGNVSIKFYDGKDKTKLLQRNRKMKRTAWKFGTERKQAAWEGADALLWPTVMIFFTMSLAGWLWEVCLHLFTEGRFVNRGFFHGPWLPIYGAGSVLSLIFLRKLRKKPFLEFLSILCLCGGLEYFISWFLEQLYDGKKWWDYSDYFLNLNGRICMEGLFAFGIGGMFLVYVLEPLLGRLFQRIPKKFLMTVCLVLLLLFAADLLYSGGNPNMGHGITQGSAQAPH